MSKQTRRIAVLINYVCVVLFLILFAVGKYYEWSLAVIIGAIALLIVVIVSFLLLQIRTRLWKQVHAKVEDLDERQTQVTLESLRYSYGIFTVISLLVLLTIAIMSGRHDSTMILLFASLLYLAHTLPASILAWREKEV